MFRGAQTASNWTCRSHLYIFPLDVQFDNLDGRYLFGFAAFDNAQVQHATGDEPLTLVFAK